MSALLIIAKKKPPVKDCSTAKRERELAVDHSATGHFYPPNGVDIATIIEASTRGAHR